MANALELGLIGSAWHGTTLGVLEGIAKTKEIGFDSYDVFEDPLTTSDDERRQIKETCDGLGLPIRSGPVSNRTLTLRALRRLGNAQGSGRGKDERQNEQSAPHAGIVRWDLGFGI